jgi:hypothetical protein
LIIGAGCFTRPFFSALVATKFEKYGAKARLKNAMYRWKPVGQLPTRGSRWEAPDASRSGEGIEPGLPVLTNMSATDRFPYASPRGEPDRLLARSTFYRELLAEREEILRHKWFESEKAGRDIGFAQALVSWLMHHRAHWRNERRQLAPETTGK